MSEIFFPWKAVAERFYPKLDDTYMEGVAAWTGRSVEDGKRNCDTIRERDGSLGTG
jgi:hypothetical protein